MCTYYVIVSGNGIILAVYGSALLHEAIAKQREIGLCGITAVKAYHDRRPRVGGLVRAWDYDTQANSKLAAMVYAQGGAS